MFKMPMDPASLKALHDESVELIRHARRLRQEISELCEASKLLRSESMQLQEDVRILHKSSFATLANWE